MKNELVNQFVLIYVASTHFFYLFIFCNIYLLQKFFLYIFKLSNELKFQSEKWKMFEIDFFSQYPVISESDVQTAKLLDQFTKFKKRLTKLSCRLDKLKFIYLKR